MSQRVIVYGGKGALGSATVSAFKKLKWWVLAIDLEKNGPHPEADNRILIKSQHVESLIDQERQVLQEAQEALEGNKVDAIICVAGGWAGGNATSEDLVKNTDLMLKQSVWPSIISTRLAGLHLSEDGLVVLTGAKPALEGTPNMIGYGLAKAATHQLVKSMAAKGSGLPSTSTTIAILPITLDTPMNRKWMPNANHSEWTPLEYVTSLFEKWIRNQERPKSGSLVIIDGEETIVGD
uniref:Dihydropteridine reductase n=1 Tax=Aceria tosichella TaxID=561515 RepID=A0A6G1S8A3_9ACAR